MGNSTKISILDRQAERLGEVFSDLIRAYQFRDRNEICCHGVSVSQCYTLDALHRFGPLTMGQLGEHLFLDVSTVTRVIDQLGEAGHVERVADADDRRVVRVRLTRKGQGIVARIRGTLLDEHRAVLEAIPPATRASVIDAIEMLLTAFVSRGCCAERRGTPRAGTSD